MPELEGSGRGTTHRRQTTRRRTAGTGLRPGTSYAPAVSANYASGTPEMHAAYWGSGAPGAMNRTTQGYNAFISGANNFNGGLGMSSLMGGGGGGGGGGRGYGGGGGGGGGGSGLTQAMLDAMLQSLGTAGPKLQLQQVQLPEFRGTPLAAFDASPYTQATRQLEAARAADAAAIAQAGTQATQTLQNNYSNAYANTPVVAGPQAAPVGVGLQQSVGGGGNQQAVTDVNQAAAGDQASFQNLLNVLAAVDKSSQNSRLNEVALNTNTANQALGAQVRGLGAGINQAQAQARNQWQQAANERNYQNSLMQQQWQRENMQRNQDIANQQAQGQWQQRNEMISSRLGPLLELLSGTQGANLNLSGLQQLLAGWAA